MPSGKMVGIDLLKLDLFKIKREKFKNQNHLKTRFFLNQFF